MKRILLCLLLSLSVFGISACSESVDYEELLLEDQNGTSILEELLEESKILNEIYFGAGIPTKEEGVSSGVYKEADISSLAEYGMTDIESIKKRTEEVFSSSMCDMLYERAFETFKTGTSVSRVRYYEDDEGRLLVRTTEESILNGEVTYDCSTAEVVSERKGRITLTMQATVITAEGLSDTEKIRVVVQKTADGFRLDSPTYLVYYAD